ncbi:MAG: DUF4302 domain-containing protein [Chitinophagaceae bacterium]
MRKSYIYFFAAVIFFSACKKDETHVFDETPDERLNEALANYQSQLSGAANGWNAVLYPQGGGAYFFYFKFNDANRVQMVSDFDSASAVNIKESSYRLKALQQPSLIFDTYSYIHVLSDPDAGVNGGTYGSGLLSDFEFYFNDSTVATSDTMKLTGRINGSKLVLTKATADQASGYAGGQFNINLFKNSLANILQYFKKLTIGGTAYDININPITKTVIFNWTDSQGNVQSISTTFYYILGGIAFSKPLIDGSTVITQLTDPSWSSSTNTLTVTAGGSTATITGAIKPLVLDTGAPRRWWQKAKDADEYWVSTDGFHVNGVDDAFGIKQIPYFSFMIFWPAYGTSGATTYDLAGFVTDSSGLALNFGAGYRAPNFTTDGRVTFTLLGTLGVVPPEAQAAFDATSAKFGQAGGYYLIQIDENDYDMVATSDAKSWISWFYPF